MRIAICDDESVFTDKMKALLVTYKQDNRLHMDIDIFATAEELLCTDLAYDMVFLDYQMPGLNGMEAARLLRLRNTVCSIVFVTNFPAFMQESFEVQPFRFFTKPMTAEIVSTLMNTFIKHQKLLSPLVIVDDGEQRVIHSRDVMYVEGAGKYSVIRTLYGTYHCSKTLAQVHALLPQHCFYRTHKSYVINLYCIDTISERHVVLTNKERVAISRDRAAAFRRDVAAFVKNYYLKT